MVTSPPPSDSEFGSQLVDSITIRGEILNILFASLLLTAVGVFLIGNLLLLDASVFKETLPIGLACFALLTIFYWSSRFLNSVPWGLVFVYSLMCLITYCRWQFLLLCTYTIAVIALGYTIRYLRFNRSELVIVVMMSLVATVVVLGVDRAYTSFDMLQRLSSGMVSQDTLFHASISAMIKNYGVTSTGLHGLIETPYHFFSHVLMASISILSGAGVFEVYGVASWILFAPILIFSIVAFCAMFEKLTTGKLSLVWLLVCVILVLVPWLLKPWRLSDSFFVSESYLVSLGLFMFGLALLFKRKIGLADIVLAVVLALFIVAAKSSVGVIYAGLWFVRVCFLREGRSLLDLMCCMLVVGAVILKSYGSAKVGAPKGIVPFSYISTYSFLGKYIVDVTNSFSSGNNTSWKSMLLAVTAVLSFIGFHFLFSWVVVVRLYCKKGFFALLQLPVAIYSFGALGAGILVAVLFEIPGGSAYYFTSVAFFVSLPGVVILILKWFYRVAFRGDYNENVIAQLVLGFSLTLMIGSEAQSAYIKFAIHKQNSKSQSVFIDSLLAIRDQSPINVYMRPDLGAMDETPIGKCTAQPFVYPAVSERPWVDVIVTRNDCTYLYYGYGQYGVTPSSQKVSVLPRLLSGMEERFWTIGPKVNY